jgi:hypothetical protein
MVPILRSSIATLHRAPDTRPVVTPPTAGGRATCPPRSQVRGSRKPPSMPSLAKAADYAGASFKATIPVFTNAIPAIFAGFNVSPNSKTPIVSVPTAPIPVQTV